MATEAEMVVLLEAATKAPLEVDMEAPLEAATEVPLEAVGADGAVAETTSLEEKRRHLRSGESRVPVVPRAVWTQGENSGLVPSSGAQGRIGTTAAAPHTAVDIRKACKCPGKYFPQLFKHPRKYILFGCVLGTVKTKFLKRE